MLDDDARARALPSVPIHADPDRLEIEALDVRRPDGGVLVGGLGLKLVPGDALLVQGASGSGKTTLLRALAGLWPFAEGRVSAPTGRDVLFLPQRPYLPLGTLRAALAYPDSEVDGLEARTALETVHLAHLIQSLDTESDWSQQLSIGEQQRLAFARVLLARPRLVFLDEATSALDEGLEQAMYSLLRSELAQTIVVSVGHRSTLNAFHTQRLQLEAEARWTLRPAEVAR